MAKTLLLVLAAFCASAQSKYNLQFRPWPDGLPWAGPITLHIEADRPSDAYRALCDPVGVRVVPRRIDP